MNGPLGKALIAHLESVFVGSNGDYSTVMESLSGISAAQAQWKPALAPALAKRGKKGAAPDGNSIWQIVEHLAASKQWLIDLLETGEASSPKWNDPRGDDRAWQESVARLRDAHFRLLSALERVSDDDLFALQPAQNNRTLLEVILSAGSAHEAHHDGQIDYLKGLQAG
jgi:hypothetical protein